MATVSVVYWQPMAGIVGQAIGLFQKSAATWHCAAFIT